MPNGGDLNSDGVTTRKIDLDGLSTLLRGHMGLILGPASLLGDRPFSELAEKLATRFGVPRKQSFLDVSDAAMTAGADAASVRTAVAEFVRAQSATPLVSTLSRVRWTSVLSACLDGNFDEQFRQATSKRAVANAAYVQNDLSGATPPRTVTVYKLLGTINTDGFAYSSGTYRIRRATWRRAVRGFSDKVKGSAALCIGMEDCPWIVADLIAELLAENVTVPSALVFLASDPLVQDSQLLSFAASKTKIILVDASASEVSKVVDSLQKAAFTRPLPFTEDKSQLAKELAPFTDVVAIVNDQIDSPIKSNERNRLFDLLFSPAIPRWDPFVHQLDFARTVGGTLRDELRALIRSGDAANTACVVTGPAASGKTTVLKRVAWDLAKAGDFVLWFKPWFYQDARGIVHEFFKALARQKSIAGRRVFAFLDDPLTLGGLTPYDVASAARAAGIELLLVTGVRLSEWLTREHGEFVASLPVVLQQSVADVLDQAEWDRLPNYLLSLGVDSSKELAQAHIQSVESRRARDTLSMLYWLLPQTRNSITKSVKDEYFRLGDEAGLTKVLIGEVSRSSKILRDAYEMIAVAEHYRAPVPMEVLVSALEVDYADWQESITVSGAAWGLLYDEQSDDAQSVVYRTRNAIVTDVIVRTLNGGLTGRTGDVRVMSQLLSACNGTAPAYREFAVSVLVPAHRLNDLTYEEGLQQYDAAINSLPFHDKTLLHHKGLWVKNKGKDPIAAGKILADALAAKIYPYAARGEADEHIHTSIAATAIDALDRGLISTDDAKAAVLQHLTKARSRNFLNASAVHVQAGLIIRLVDKIDRSQSADIFFLANSAVSEVDRTLLLLDNPFTARKFVEKDLNMLSEIRGKLIDRVTDGATLEDEAEDLWKRFKRQDGFIFRARSLYRKAAERSRGTEFNEAFTYCQAVIARVEGEGEHPLPALYDVALYIYYHWRIRRAVQSAAGTTIDWQLVADYSAHALRAPEAVDDPFHKYVHAVALSHLGKWNEAHAIFGSLRASSVSRELLWTPRDFLMNDSGGMRSIQGMMTQSGDRKYLQSADLQTDLVVSREDRWPREGEEVPVAYIRFSFGGATAVLTP